MLDIHEGTNYSEKGFSPPISISGPASGKPAYRKNISIWFPVRLSIGGR